MKKIILTMLIIFFVNHLWAQNNDASSTTQGTGKVEDRNFRIPLIGESAPSFTAESTNGTINFPDDFGAKWKILFSHPQDFTPVCSTEILQLAKMQDEFDKLGIKLIVVSTDELETHLEWKKSMEALKLNEEESVKIKFPIVDDDKRIIAKEYGMIHPSSNSTRDVRGVFIIDPDNVIQAIYFYPSNVGRNTDELLRMVTALKTAASGNVLIPANWRAGNDVLVPIPPKTDPVGKPIVPEGYYSPIWYLWFKKGNNNNGSEF
ncbi:MAG TPA: peroxiredoxin [Bacteroidales bacterium]|nr:peroxiredoxin [Bacteroidales bacterium]